MQQPDTDQGPATSTPEVVPGHAALGQPATTPAPRSVAVLGSCITRDNFNSRFNPGYKRWFKVGPTTNQSSMIALMSPPVEEPWEPVAPMVDYGMWNVRSDLSREILDLLRTEQPDVIVLDFFGDVHFGVVRTADGRYLTNNRWRLHKTDLFDRLKGDPATTFLRWQDDRDGYFALWTEAMDRFAAHVAEHCPDALVVLHCGFDVSSTIASGESTPGPFGPPRRRAAARRRTAFWRQLHEHARDAYGWQEIDLGREHYVTFADHPWGAMEVHYTADYYPRFLAELNHLVLRDELDPESAAAVDALSAAASARVRAEVAWWRARKQAERDAAAARERPWWKRALRPRRAARVPAPPVGGEDHRMLEELRHRLDDDTFTRVRALVDTADEHVAWLRAVEGSTLR